MTKRHPQFDNRNPFIPSLSPTCQRIDQALIFSVLAVGLVAVLATLFTQF